jgi:hypothetical protein
MLLGCTPNPSTGNAAVHLNVPSTRHVLLDLRTMDGRLVASVVDRIVAAGTHALPLPADMPSGVYLCRLVSGSIVETELVEVIR